MNEQELMHKLVELGVSHHKAVELVNRFEERQILRQIAWLPYRQAKKPASLLIAAVEGDFEAPSLLASEFEGAGKNP